jgi:hypothetical protein
MKNKLQSILPRTLPSPLFGITCALLLIVGGIGWAATEKIGCDADAGMRALTQPATKPTTMLQASRR